MASRDSPSGELANLQEPPAGRALSPSEADVPIEKGLSRTWRVSDRQPFVFFTWIWLLLLSAVLGRAAIQGSAAGKL